MKPAQIKHLNKQFLFFSLACKLIIKLIRTHRTYCFQTQCSMFCHEGSHTSHGNRQFRIWEGDKGNTSLHHVENSPLKKLWTCCKTDYGHSIMSYRFFFRESSSDSKTVFNIKRKSIISMANERGSFFQRELFKKCNICFLSKEYLVSLLSLIVDNMKQI